MPKLYCLEIFGSLDYLGSYIQYELGEAKVIERVKRAYLADETETIEFEDFRATVHILQVEGQWRELVALCRETYQLDEDLGPLLLVISETEWDAVNVHSAE